MKIRIEVDENIQDDEVIIRCANLNEDIQNLQGAIKDALSKKNRIISVSYTHLTLPTIA